MSPQKLSPAHQKVWNDFADDPELAAERIGYVVPGKAAGAVVPFVPTPPQRHVFQTIREIQAFRYVEQARFLPKTERKEAYDLVWNRHKGRPDAPGFAEAWQKTLEFGPGKAFRLLKESTQADVNDAVRMMLGKPRQIGGTAVCTWLVALRSALIENHGALVIAHKGFAAEYALAMVRRYLDNWAERGFAWAFPGYGGKADASLSLDNGSWVSVESAGGKDIRAPKVDFLQLDEFAHYDTNAAVNAIATAVQDHCWVIKNSTARGVAGQFYLDWQSALYVKDAVEAYETGKFPETWNRFFRCFTPWWADARYVMPVEEGEEEQIIGNLSDYERAWRERLGPEIMTAGRIKWRRDKVRQASDPVLSPEAFIAQEFPGDDVEMFQSSGDRPFDSARVRTMSVRAATATKRARFLRQMDQGAATPASAAAANLVVWERPKKGAKYVIGADVAQGLAHRDRSWAVVLERVDGVFRRQVAEWRGHIPAKAFAHVLALMSDWYNGAFLIPEVNGPGLTTVATLLEDLEVPAVYRRKILGRTGDPGFADNSFVGGFLTTQGSKAALISELIHTFDNGNIEILSEPLLKEMAVFSRDEKGRFGAPAGQHDDGVMALALASYGDSVFRGAPPLHDIVEELAPRHERALPAGLSEADAALMVAMQREMDEIKKQETRAARKVWWHG